ncbi:exo-beta-N-acetylmuramidase NamZ domain-containing protein, partial [Thermodesulfobacteriota bacterium]
MGKVYTGLDLLREGYWKKLKGCRLGLLSNQASIDSRLTSAKEVISKSLPGQLKVLFGPQHGHGGEDQDNMVETNHSIDRELRIPIFSLYSEHREPPPETLDLLDVLIIDLQDVGTRVYTFASTMLNCIKAAARSKKKVLILDRPNPLGGEITEGNILKPELYSFVGPFSLPMRHGLTMGEMSRIFDYVFKINSDLDIIPMNGWRREMLWHDTGLKWIMPSPNMPLPE